LRPKKALESFVHEIVFCGAPEYPANARLDLFGLGCDLVSCLADRLDGLGLLKESWDLQACPIRRLERSQGVENDSLAILLKLHFDLIRCNDRFVIVVDVAQQTQTRLFPSDTVEVQ
jgi:hypothetical protein